VFSTQIINKNIMNYKNILGTMLCLFIGSTLFGQLKFSGTIIDQNTAEPLVGATISTAEKGIAVTNYNGQYTFELSTTPKDFFISYIGYETITLSADALSDIISLTASSSELNQVIISANRDVQQRTDAPISISVVSPQLLEDSKATRLDEVLNKVSGVYMVDLGNEQHTMAIRQPINYKGLFLYLEDGLPIRPTGVFNHNALLEMNMAALRRIEVIRDADMTGSLDSTFFYGEDYTSQQTFTNRAVDALRTKLVYNHYWDAGSKTTIAAFARDNSIRQNPSYRVRNDYSPWANPDGNPNLAHGEINDNSVISTGFVVQHKQTFDLLNGANVTIGASLDNSPNTFKANYISIVRSNENIYTAFTETDSVLTDYEVDLRNFGTYANFDIKLTKQLQLTAALRYDILNFDFRNNLDEDAFSGAPNDVDNFSAITPKVGLTYNLGEGNGLYANYSQGFLPPQISELYRGVQIPVLKPAQFNNYEIGGWFQLNNKVAFDFGIYQLDGKNEIISVRLDDGTRENRNAGQTQHRGIEYGVNWQIIDGLQFRLSGTNASHNFIDYIENGADYSGNEMGQAPSWIANSELTYKPAFAPSLRAALEWLFVECYFSLGPKYGLAAHFLWFFI